MNGKLCVVGTRLLAKKINIILPCAFKLFSCGISIPCWSDVGFGPKIKIPYDKIWIATKTCIKIFNRCKLIWDFTLSQDILTVSNRCYLNDYWKMLATDKISYNFVCIAILRQCFILNHWPFTMKLCKWYIPKFILAIFQIFSLLVGFKLSLIYSAHFDLSEEIIITYRLKIPPYNIHVQGSRCPVAKHLIFTCCWSKSVFIWHYLV